MKSFHVFCSSNLWKIKLVSIKLVEDIIWPECELHVITFDHREGTERLKLIRGQISEL